MATYWKDGKQVDVDMGALEMRLPDGRVVPQIHMGADATRDTQPVQRRQAHGKRGQRAPMRGRQGTADAVVSGGASGETRTYRYLGCEISPSPDTGYERTRAEVVRQTAQILQIIGSLPGLDNARMCEVMGVAVHGILGFFGRTTPMTWADCEAIEAARAGALRARGFSPGNPRVQIYAATEQGGLGHPHAYRVAAGALIAQIDRALSGDDGEPQREAARSAVTEKCKQLGCRGESPLTWDPRHIRDLNGESDLIEAWLLAKRRTRVQAVATSSTENEQMRAALERDDLWRDAAAAGPLLWEANGTGAPAYAHARRLAAAGVVYWADVTSETTGENLTWDALRTRMWRARLHGTAAQREYAKLCKAIRSADGREAAAWDMWRERVRRGDAMQRRTADGTGVRHKGRDDEWDWDEIVAKRRAPAAVGGREYLVRWAGSERDVSWVRGCDMVNAMRGATGYAQRAPEVPASMYERLKGDAGGGGGRTQSAQAARRACLSTAPGSDRQQPPDATMTWLIEELEQHSRETRGVEYGGAEREHTDLPTMVTRNGDTGRWPR